MNVRLPELTENLAEAWLGTYEPTSQMPRKWPPFGR